jgi:hypothetical protein
MIYWNQLDQKATCILVDLIWYDIARNEDHMVYRAREWDTLSQHDLVWQYRQRQGSQEE